MRRLYLLALVCLYALSAYGQGGSPLTPQASATGNLTAAGATCATTNACVAVHLQSGVPSVAVTITGTWSATMVVEMSADNAVTWVSAGTAPTANGQTTYTLTAQTDFRVRVSAFTSGTVGVFINVSVPTIVNLGPITNTGGGLFSKAGVIDASASPYNVVPGHYAPDLTATNGSAVVTCPNADCKFLTTAATGQLMNTTNMTSDISALTSVAMFAAGTTIASIQSDTQVTLSAVATGGVSCTAACVGVWGVDQGANLQAAWAAATAACVTLQIPSGFIPVLSGQFNTQNTGCRVGQGVFSAIGAIGWGPGTSVIVPMPGFLASTCTGGPGSNVCFGGVQGAAFQNFEILGIGNSALGGTFNGKTAFGFDASTQCCGNYQGTNLYLNSWGANTAGFTGLAFSGASAGSFVNVRNDGVGAIGCDITTSVGALTGYMLYAQYCANNLTKSLFIHSAAGVTTNVYSYGSFYGNNGATSGTIAVHAQNVSTGVTNFYSYGDQIPYGAPGGTSANAIVADGANTKVYLNGSTVVQATGDAASNAIDIITNANVWATNSIIHGASSSIPINRISGTFHDQGGNSAGVVGSPTITPSCTVTGAGTTAVCSAFVENEETIINIASAGTGQAATGTVTLTFAGSFGGTAAPICSAMVSIAGTAWNARATVMVGPTAPTTAAVVYTWDNNAAVLVAANTYQFYSLCSERTLQ